MLKINNLDNVSGLNTILKHIEMENKNMIHHSSFDYEADEPLEMFLFHPVQTDRFNYLASN